MSIPVYRFDDPVSVGDGFVRFIVHTQGARCTCYYRGDLNQVRHDASHLVERLNRDYGPESTGYGMSDSDSISEYE